MKMPITRRQFELGVDPHTEEWMRKIYQFLSERQKEAFTREELEEALSVPKRPHVIGLSISEDLPKINEIRSSFADALSTLEEVRGAEKRSIGGELYYSFGIRLDTSSWEQERSPF